MPDWYQIKKYDLGEARTNYKITGFPEKGDCVLVLENENQQPDETFIKLDSQTAHAFDLEEHRRLRQRFRTLYLTNLAASRKTLILLIGKGKWEVERHYPEEEVYTVNADTVDSLHASASVEAGKLLALDSEGKFPNTVLDGMQSELDANKPDSPAVGDMFIATDTGRVYVCFTAGAWTDITGFPAELKKLTTAEIQQLENIGDVPISYAQWGYLGGTSGIDHYVDRGDPSGWDFTLTGLTTDGNLHDLDLSGIIPAGTVAVEIRACIKDDATGSYLEFREKGNTNYHNALVQYSQVADILVILNGLVAVDANRKIQYRTTATTFTEINILIRGWWIP